MTVLVAGDDVVLELTVLDEDGAAVDLDAATAVDWSIARSAGSGAGLADKALGAGVVVTDGPAGLMEVTLQAADTAPFRGDYHHRARITIGGKIGTATFEPITFESIAY